MEDLDLGLVFGLRKANRAANHGDVGDLSR